MFDRQAWTDRSILFIEENEYPPAPGTVAQTLENEYTQSYEAQVKAILISKNSDTVLVEFEKHDQTMAYYDAGYILSITEKTHDIRWIIGERSDTLFAKRGDNVFSVLCPCYTRGDYWRIE
jgi:hypothetical protein